MMMVTIMRMTMVITAMITTTVNRIPTITAIRMAKIMSTTSIAAFAWATPDQLAGPGGWRRGLGTILAVGLRPCSGAILVLVFSLAQGLFWAGIAATF